MENTYEELKHILMESSTILNLLNYNKCYITIVITIATEQLTKFVINFKVQ